MTKGNKLTRNSTLPEFEMYASAFVLGFHGCDESVGEKILAGKEQLKTSVNEYDWLGEVIYGLWENSPRRALDWAEFRSC